MRQRAENVVRVFRNRDFIMVLALALGLVWGDAARWTEVLTLPGLAVVMTLSTMAVSGTVFRSPRTLMVQGLAGMAMSYLVLGGVLLGLNALLIRDEAIRSGFVIVAAVPPAVAVIPFTLFLKGDDTLTLVGTVGAYLGALVITPLVAFSFLGSSFVAPWKLLTIMVELILAPLVLSRILVWTRTAEKIAPVKGTIINWSFFLLTYTIVGLNRSIFLTQPLVLLPAASIALVTTFLLGWLIKGVGRWLGVSPRALISLVLLGTLKNYGLAGGLALALFSKTTAVPATVSTVFMIVYIIWLQFQARSRP